MDHGQDTRWYQVQAAKAGYESSAQELRNLLQYLVNPSFQLNQQTKYHQRTSGLALLQRGDVGNSRRECDPAYGAQRIQVSQLRVSHRPSMPHLRWLAEEPQTHSEALSVELKSVEKYHRDAGTNLLHTTFSNQEYAHCGQNGHVC